MSIHPADWPFLDADSATLSDIQCVRDLPGGRHRRSLGSLLDAQIDPEGGQHVPAFPDGVRERFPPWCRRSFRSGLRTIGILR